MIVMFQAVAFVLVNDVVEVFEEVQASLMDPEEELLDEWLDNFQRT